MRVGVVFPAAMVAFGAAACFDPSVPPCTVVCAVSADCPGSLACTAQGLCAESATASCAAVPDAAADGPGSGADAAVGPLTVVALDSADLPAVGVQVIIADAGGMLIAEPITDAAGTVVVTAPAGASATVVYPVQPGPSQAMTTFTDLPLRAHVISVRTFSTNYDAVTVQWTAEPGMNSYELYATCGVGPTSPTTTSGVALTVDVDRRCSSNFDIVIIGRDTTLSLAPVTQIATGVAAPMVALTGSWQSLDNFSGQLEHLPAAALRIYDDRLRISDVRPPTRPVSGGSIPSTGTLPPMDRPAGVAVDVVSQFMLSGGASVMLFDRIPAGTTVYNRDLDGVLLAVPTAVAQDIETRTITWTPMLAGTVVRPPDFTIGQLSYQHDGTFYDWTMIGPGGDGSMAFPDLPGDRVFEPRPGDQAFEPSVQTFAVEPAGAVEALRAVIRPGQFEGDFFVDPSIEYVTYAFN
jgi:hypothetical protein